MTTTPLNLSNGCNGDRESCPLTSIQCLWLTRGECVWVWPVPTQGLPTPHWPLPAARQSSLAAATFSLSLPLSHPLNLTFYIFQLIQYIPLRTKLAKLSTTFIFIHHGRVINAHVQHTLHFIPFHFPFKDSTTSLTNKTVMFKYNKHVHSTIIMVSQQFSKTSSSSHSFSLLYIFQHCTVCKWSRD